jgi:Leucine-rich repeat (LRR) protein
MDKPISIKQLEKIINKPIFSRGLDSDFFAKDYGRFSVDLDGVVTDLSLSNLSEPILSEVISFIVEDLPNLRSLELTYSQLGNITPLIRVPTLTKLNLSGNAISNIHPLIEFPNLIELNLSNNIVSDISTLRKLKNLKRINLFSNPIKILEPWILDFKVPIYYSDSGTFLPREMFIRLGKNPLIAPPPEIIQQGNTSITNYFKQIKYQNEDYLFEAKLDFVHSLGMM